MTRNGKDIVVCGDHAAVQRGEHAGKMGRISAINGSVITIAPFDSGPPYPRASWSAFEIELADVWVTHPVPPHLACWWVLDSDMQARPTSDPNLYQQQWSDPRRRVGRTDVGNKTVSTVFRGTPFPSATPDGRLDWRIPMLWETSVYDPDQPEGESGYEIYAMYQTHVEAVVGHERAVATLATLVAISGRESTTS